MAALSAAGFFMYGTMSTYGAIVLELAPARSRAAYWGSTSTIGQAAGVIAPGAMGWIVSASGSFAGGFALMAGALALAAVTSLLVGRREMAQPGGGAAPGLAPGIRRQFRQG